MIRLFVRLKLRLLRNTLRTSAGVGLVIFTIVAGLISTALSAALLGTDTDLLRWAAPVIAAFVMVGWVLGPLFFGGSDETIDTTRLALYPLRARELAPGLLAANLVGPGAIAVAIPLFAIAIQAPGLARKLLSIVLVIATVAFASTTSRLLLTLLGASLRKRSRRDLGTFIAGIAAASVAIGSQLLLQVGFSRQDLIEGGQLARWLPGGWTGGALGKLVDGDGFAVPLLIAGGTLALTAGLARLWIRALDEALAEVAENEVTEVEGRHMIAPKNLLTRTFHQRRPLLYLVLVKELRYLRRHPRYRIQVVSQGLILILGGAPFLSAILEREPTAVLVGSVPALTAGLTSSNLLGPDGRAFWAEALAVRSLRTLLRGRALAFVMLGLGGAVLVTLGSAVWTGGWRYVPVALGAALGMATLGAGVGTITSTLAPYGYANDDNPNPFATSESGQGCIAGMITFSGVIIGLILAGPILAGLAFARDSLVVGAGVVVVAPLYGALFFMGLSHLAGDRAERRTPELVGALDAPQ